MSQAQAVQERSKASVVTPMLLSHGTLMCKDLAKSRRFHEEFLGLEVVDRALGSVGSVLPLLKAVKLKLIAFAQKTRLPEYPDVPTVTEAGGPTGYEVDTWVSLVAPRRTPAEVAQRISSDIAAALADATIRERFKGIGVDPMPSSPAQLAELIRNDTKVYGEIVKRAGVKAE